MLDVGPGVIGNPFLDGWASGWAPDPVRTVSQWADQERVLPKKGSAEPGPWRTSRTPYLREIMDNLSVYDTTERMVFMKGSQIGGSEAGFNWIGYCMTEAPAPFLMVQPTIDMSEKVSKQRIGPMIDVTPSLRAVVPQAKSRDSGNTLMMKDFPGGVLIFSGANSAASLASMPIRYLFADEVDRFPADVDDEGDPLSLAEQRTATFGRRRKVFINSTPTVKGASRIEREYLDSDQRRYFCPCPHCGHKDFFRWDRIRWESDKPETAQLLCTSCGVLLDERYKTWMMAEENGAEWIATAVAKDGKTKGYHLSALYSPVGWKSWADLVRQFLAAQKSQTLLKTFVNTGLGETWEEKGEVTEVATLLERVEDYPAEVPANVAVLTMGVDVQKGGWLEVVVKGFGPGEESWLIDHERLDAADGNVQTDDDVWRRLDEMRLRSYRRADGVLLRPAICLVDSGWAADTVYKYCAPRQAQMVFASKGIDSLTKSAIVSEGASKKGGKARLFMVSTHPLKSLVLDRLKINPGQKSDPNPGYMHFPTWADEEYFLQLTGEKLVGREGKGRHRGRLIYEWVPNHTRWECLDCEVYCLGGLRVLQNILGPRTYKDLDALLLATRSQGEAPRHGGRRVHSSIGR